MKISRIEFEVPQYFQYEDGSSISRWYTCRIWTKEELKDERIGFWSGNYWVDVYYDYE